MMRLSHGSVWIWRSTCTKMRVAEMAQLQHHQISQIRHSSGQLLAQPHSEREQPVQMRSWQHE